MRKKKFVKFKLENFGGQENKQLKSLPLPRTKLKNGCKMIWSNIVIGSNLKHFKIRFVQMLFLCVL